MIAGYSSASPIFSCLPLDLYYHFVSLQALSSLYPHLYSRPRSRFRFRFRFRFRSRPHPYPRAHCCTRPPSRPGPPPCSYHRFLPLVPDAPFSVLYHIIEQAPGFTPEFAGYLQAPPAVYRDYTAYEMAIPSLLLCLFAHVVDTRALFPVSDPIPVTVPVTTNVPVTVFTTSLVSVPAPVPVPILCSSSGFHPRSRSSFQPFSAPVVAAVLRSIAAPHPRPVPAPSPSPSLFSSPSSPPCPFRSPLPPRTLIPPPPPFDPSRNSDPVTPTVQCPCIDTGPCKRSCQVPASTILVCRDDDACRMKVSHIKPNTIAPENVPLPFPPSDSGTRWSVSPTCSLPI